ncbi:MAG: peptidylprolyl isomerase [Candidatus Kapaibacterium sp.]
MPMRQTILLLATLILFPIGLAAQMTPAAGKPRYAISVFRAGKPIGTIRVELYPDIAPKHVRNFDSLVAIKFFDSTAFHRVIPGFMIQGGDPNTKDKPESTWGFGDPDQTTVPAEFSKLSHRRGILSAARSSDPNSATSQFFICVGNPTYLDGNYTAYGHVIAGMNVADSVVASPRDPSNDRPLEKVIMMIAADGFSTDPTPTAPMLLAPADGATRIDTTKSVTWDSVPGAVMYEVQFSRSADFSTIDTTDFTPLGKTKTSLLTQGAQRYYWRVRASNGGERGPFSEVRSLMTGLAAPLLLTPINNAKSVPTNAQLTWRSAGGAGTYHLKVSTTASLATPVLDKTGITDTTYLAARLEPNKRYYWRVTGSDTIGDGPASPIFYFTTGAATGVEEAVSAADGFTLDGPNPARDAVSLRFTLRRESDVRVTMADASGREIATLFDGAMEPGERILPADLRGLPSGVYLCRLETGGRVETRRLVVVR